MIEHSNISAIGKFQKTHALKGELNAILDIDPIFLEEGNAAIVEIDGILVPFYTASVRPKGSTSFLIRLDGIDTEGEAKNFVNKIIYALKSELASFLDVDESEITDDEDLIGYQIFDIESNEPIGRITGIDSSTSNLLFIVESADGEEIFVPAADEFIISIDDDKKLIEMNLPSGLIDLN